MLLLSISIRVSAAGTRSASERPGSRSSGRARMPKCPPPIPASSDEHSTPRLTRPPTRRSAIRRPLASVTPAGANADVMPTRTLGAPQTVVVRSVPHDTVTNVCTPSSGSTVSTRATSTPSRVRTRRWTPSTSAVDMVSRSAIVSGDRSAISTYWPTHSRETCTANSFARGGRVTPLREIARRSAGRRHSAAGCRECCISSSPAA